MTRKRKSFGSSSRKSRVKKAVPVLKKLGRAGGYIVKGHLDAITDLYSGYAAAVETLLEGDSRVKKKKKK